MHARSRGAVQVQQGSAWSDGEKGGVREAGSTRSDVGSPLLVRAAGVGAGM
jgi:hypothetical protein